MLRDRVNSWGLEEPDAAERAGFALLEGALQQFEEYLGDEEPSLPGDEDHRMTITPFHGEITDPGEHGYRRVPIYMDAHDASHDLDDPDPDGIRIKSLSKLIRR